LTSDFALDPPSQCPGEVLLTAMSLDGFPQNIARVIVRSGTGHSDSQGQHNKRNAVIHLKPQTVPG
jgi:hypothetical protein